MPGWSMKASLRQLGSAISGPRKAGKTSAAQLGTCMVPPPRPSIPGRTMACAPQGHANSRSVTPCQGLRGGTGNGLRRLRSLPAPRASSCRIRLAEAELPAEARACGDRRRSLRSTMIIRSRALSEASASASQRAPARGRHCASPSRPHGARPPAFDHSRPSLSPACCALSENCAGEPRIHHLDVAHRHAHFFRDHFAQALHRAPRHWRRPCAPAWPGPAAG